MSPAPTFSMSDVCVPVVSNPTSSSPPSPRLDFRGYTPGGSLALSRLLARPLVIDLMFARHAKRHAKSIQWKQAEMRDMHELALAALSVNVLMPSRKGHSTPQGTTAYGARRTRSGTIGTSHYVREVHRVLKDDVLSLYVKFRQLQLPSHA